MYFSSMDLLSIFAYSITGFVGIIGNAVLLVAIKLRSPHSWKSYTILLANGALIDLIASFSTSLSIERFVVYRDVTTTVYLGPCVLVSGFFCHIQHSIMLHAVTQSVFLVVICFCYRLYVLGRSPPSSLKMIIVCIGIYLPTFSILVASFFTNDASDEVRKALLLHPEHEQFEEYVMEGHVDVQPRPLAKFIQLYMIGPIIPLCIIVFLVRWKVLSKINAEAVKMSEKTNEMHKSLVKVLTLHATLPIFYFLACLAFVIMKWNISHSSIFEYSLRWFTSCMHALGPLITLYNVRVLRNFVLCCGKSAK